MSDTLTERQIHGISLPPAGSYSFDTAHTNIGFVARHMLSKVRGHFAEYDGQLKIGEAIEDSSVNVTIQTASVTPATSSATVTCGAGTSSRPRSTRRSASPPRRFVPARAATSSWTATSRSVT